MPNTLNAIALGTKTLKIPVKDCEKFAVYRVKVGEK